MARADMPFDREAEYAVIGAVITDPVTFAEVTDWLSDDDFLDLRCKGAYGAFQTLWGAGKPIDEVSTAAVWQPLNTADACTFLVERMLGVPTAASIGFYGKIVHVAADRRRLILAGKQIATDAADVNLEPEDVMAMGEAALRQAVEGRATEDPNLAVLVTDAMIRLETARTSGISVRGIGTDIVELDALTNGMNLGDLVIIAARPSQGKGHPHGTKVLTPNGWVNVEALIAGDAVVGSDGQPTRITDVYRRGVLPVSRVTFSDGASVLCDNEHLWKVNHRRSKLTPEAVKQTSDLAQNLRDGDHWAWRIPLVTPPALDSPKPREIDPYILGVLLGDGCLTKGVTFTPGDLAVPAEVEAVLPSGLTLQVGHATDKTPSNQTWRIITPRGASNPYLDELGRLGLRNKLSYEKFIPDQYMFAPVADRLALLQGLMDTDGWCDAITLQFTSSSERLARDVRALCQSLGCTTGFATKNQPKYTHLGEVRIGRPSYMVTIAAPYGFEPFRARADSYHRAPGRRPPQRNVVSIQPEGSAEVTCIRVEAADSLYVTEDFIVTHNSSLATQFAYIAAVQQCQVVLVSLEMTAESITDRLLCQINRVSSVGLRTGKIGAEQLGALYSNAEYMKKLPITIIDTPRMDMTRLYSRIRRLQRQGRCDYLVVDYLQLLSLKGKRKFENRVQEVTEISGQLKQIAAELRIPVIALSQLNRQTEARGDHRPMLSDLRDSGSIEQDADVVLMMYRPKLHREGASEQEKNETTLIVAKNRNGPIGDVKLYFHADQFRFTEPPTTVPHWTAA